MIIMMLEEENNNNINFEITGLVHKKTHKGLYSIV